MKGDTEMKKNYIFVKTVKDAEKNGVLLISWEYAYNGVVLELSYTDDGEEKDLYKNFVNYIDQAVNDGVLPVQLSKWNWHHWVSIENHSTPRQYSIISHPDPYETKCLFWKSTFVPGFFCK